MQIGITERGDAGLNFTWQHKLNGLDGVILITKRPSALTQNGLSQIPIPFIIHCTITGWGGTPMEPNVNPLEIELPAYKQLVELYGPERIILRVDPIFLDSNIDVDIIKTIKLIGSALGRVRISFFDAYPHALTRIKSTYPKFKSTSFHYPLALRQQFINQLKLFFNKDVEVCGEPDIACTGCVSLRDFKAMNLQYDSNDAVLKGQRPQCPCLAAKTELLQNKYRCSHGCLYCYWKGEL